MVFSLISRLVNGVKEGVTAGLKGVADVSSTTVNVVKDVTVKAQAVIRQQFSIEHMVNKIQSCVLEALK